MKRSHETRVCHECGNIFRPRHRSEEFCQAKCRKDFHNRRMTRGAVLYDLIMINRYDRGLAKAVRVFRRLTRVAMYFREQDERERSGRPSWRKPADVMEATSWAEAVVVNRNVAGNRRREA